MSEKTRSASVRPVLRSLFKKGDILLVVVILVVVALTVWLSLRGNGQTAEIYIDGKLAYTLDLSTDRELEILDGKMVIAVRDGKAYVARSDCGEQLCVSSAAVSAEGGMIVCLPNRVVIKIAGGEVDAVT